MQRRTLNYGIALGIGAILSAIPSCLVGYFKGRDVGRYEVGSAIEHSLHETAQQNVIRARRTDEEDLAVRNFPPYQKQEELTDPYEDAKKRAISSTSVMP